MEEIALGILQMSEVEFYKTTPRAFSNKLVGFERFQEARLKERWEMHRELIITTLSPHLKKTERNKPLSELYPLAWDKAKQIKTKRDPMELWKDIDKRKQKV